MSAASAISKLIEAALANWRPPASQIVGQLSGGQVAPAASGSPGVVDRDDLIPPTRTLTIDGVAHDLSADRSWTTSGGGGGMTNPMTTQDDIIVGGTSGAPARLAKGSDGQVLTVDPSTHHLAWATPTATSGALTLIAESLLASDASGVTFSSIPGTYRHLRLVGYGRLAGATSDDYVYVQFNGDTGSNYDEQRGLWVNGITSIVALYGLTRGRIGELPGASAAAANAPGSFEILIPHYAGTTWDTIAQSWGGFKHGTSGNSIAIEMFSVSWRSTAAVTSITLIPGTGDFKAGCLFSLYGMA
jgi:hypothetical protein